MTSIPSSTPDTTRNDLAGIVERDAAKGFSKAGITMTQPESDRRVLLGLLREVRAELDFFVTDDSPDIKPDDMTTEDWDFGVLTWRAHEDRATVLLSRLSVLDDTTRNDR